MRLICVTIVTILVACGPPTKASECDEKMNDCLRQCQQNDSDVERSTMQDAHGSADRRTLCEQECDDVCRD